MSGSDKKILLNNTIMMYLLSIAKLVIPLISLPYLTNILTKDCYGSIAFVKSIITYMQILVDFGFLLSATKDIVLLIKYGKKPNKEIGNTLYAQLILCIIAVIAMLVCCFCFDILRGYELYSFLSLLTVLLSVFLFEYVFKAYEQMGKIAIRYVLMKVLALVLTLIFVKNDGDIYLIPVFDIISSLIAVILVIFQLKKLNVKIDFSIKRIKEGWVSLRKSFVYFISNFASTAFSALNTLIIGIYLSKSDVADWSVALQIVSAVHALYTPIINSVFPTMVRTRNLKTIHKIMALYMPLILVGCVAVWFLGDWGVNLVFGEEYINTAKILKILIPLLIFSFPAMLYGWPCLGAINKQKMNTISTIIGACVQTFGVICLILFGWFNIFTVSIVRSITEFVLCAMRVGVVYKNKKLFVKPLDLENEKPDLENEKEPIS